MPADVSVGTAEATLTINDADAATVSIAAPAAVTDPSGSGTTLAAVDFTVTLSNPVATGAVSVAWSVGTSTATSGSDYTALTPGTLTFPAGSTTAQTISVTVLDDNVVEASETLVLGIAASGTLPADVSVGTAEATLTIDDADAATVSIAAPAAVSDPSGSGTTLTAVNFTVTLSNPVATGAVSVSWSVGTSTATSGSDYTALTPGTLTFPAGSTTAQTISVTVLDDDVVEASRDPGAGDRGERDVAGRCECGHRGGDVDDQRRGRGDGVDSGAGSGDRSVRQRDDASCGGLHGDAIESGSDGCGERGVVGGDLDGDLGQRLHGADAGDADVPSGEHDGADDIGDGAG